MEPGQVCRLELSAHPAVSTSTSDIDSEEAVTVTVVIVAVRTHAEDARRRLYYVRCTHVDLSSELARQRKKSAAPSWHGVALGAIGSGSLHSCNELRVSSNSFVSSDGYHYRYDGWYEATALRPLREGEASSPPPALRGTALQPPGPVKGEGESNSSPPASSVLRRDVPEEWVAAMERDSAVCEVVYVCYAFQPWFPSTYTALQYLALPEADVCHSVYLCHRCLSPFFTREQYFVHLEGGYCGLRQPPGRLLYHDTETGHKAFLVDGAKHLHYGRCLSLLGKHFIESKLLANDVDLYEYVVVTAPRAALPHHAAAGMSPDDFHEAAASFDAEEWGGDVVVGYFSRLKHHPDHTLSCIVTIPVFQRMRVATFLLDLAYWMTRQRQRLCGRPRCCGSAGGSISRPLSPHGQSLLLSYWRRALLRALGNVAPRRRASRIAVAEPSFTLPELQAMMDIAIHAQDLEMLLLQSEFTFYAVAAPGGRGNDDEGGSEVEGGLTSPSSGAKKSRRDAHAGGRAASTTRAKLATSTPSTASSLSPATPLVFSLAAPPVLASTSAQRFVATMVLEGTLLDAAAERVGRSPGRTHAVFNTRWLVKDSRGAYAYDIPQFHY